jgi:ubiquitin carboxyl-terminal hydrolase 9/24
MRLVSLPLICKVVTSDASIKVDCFDLLYVFVTDLGTQAIQYLFDKKLMPTLVHKLVRTIGKFADRSNSTTSSSSDEYVLSKYNSILSTARAVSTAIMKHILLLDESTLKRMDTKSIENLRRELHRLYKDMCKIEPPIVVVTKENSNNDGVGSGDGVKLLYEYFAFWRELSLRLITSSSLPLRLFGWDEISTLITESERARPIPRAYMVSGAGTEWINGLYEFDSKRVNHNGYVKSGIDLQYHMTIQPPNDDGVGGSHHSDGGVVVVDDDSSDAPQQQHHLPQLPPMAVVVPSDQTDIPSRGHGSTSGRLRTVTLFLCTMRSSLKWWFLSEAHEHEPGTDKDVDYYQHKSKREEQGLPSKAGWVTCRAGSDPPPTLEAVGILEPRGEEYNTLEHQLARWAKDNGVIELVLGDGIHPEVVSRSAGLIKFLAGMSREGNNETSSTRS